MKRLVLTLVITAAAGILCAAPTLASGDGNGIEGSPHDFSTDAWNFRGEICRTCHVPHDHGRDAGLVGLLWNHALPNHAYTMYSSSTLDGAQDAQPTGIAKMCLGCHDGTVALDEFDRNIGTPGTVFIQDVDNDYRFPRVPGAEGTDLSATHPLSIVYDETADPSLQPKTDPMGGSGLTIEDVLEFGKVQCSSCHDVHDSPGESVPGTHLLRVAQNTGQGGDPSGLCLACHIK